MKDVEKTMHGLLIELRERVERASGPDRALDAYVLTNLEAERAPHSWAECEALRSNPYLNHTDLPPITASLDAALAFVEQVLPGWRVAEMKDGIRHDDGEYCHIALWCPANPYLGHKFGANAKTPCLALIASAIRALEDDHRG